MSFIRSFLLLSLFLICLSAANAQWTNGQDAIKVIGQTDFVTNTSGTSNNKLRTPTSTFIDAAGRLWVAEFSNNRVLRYDNAANLANGAAADAVFGQPNFVSNTPGNAANQMDLPRAAFLDSNGALWVSDQNNNRILRFDNAINKSNGAAADGVLGQPNFGSSSPGLSANALTAPICITMKDGSLFVSDIGNHRVLRFDNAALKINGASADGVLGQPDFDSATPGTGASNMDTPSGVIISPNGTLWLADNNNDRVLRYDNALIKANGAAADGVLGQTGFGLVEVRIGAEQLAKPRGLGLDELGSLYVSQSFDNDRILIFLDAADKPNGAAADFVLGQPDFLTFGGGLAANRIDSGGPTCFAVDSKNGLLWYPDDQNNRVLAFQASEPIRIIPTMGQWALLILFMLIASLGLIAIRKGAVA